MFISILLKCVISLDISKYAGNLFKTVFPVSKIINLICCSWDDERNSQSFTGNIIPLGCWRLNNKYAQKQLEAEHARNFFIIEELILMCILNFKSLEGLDKRDEVHAIGLVTIQLKD